MFATRVFILRCFVFSQDTVAVEELKIGDNDTLSAKVSEVLTSNLLNVILLLCWFNSEKISYRSRLGCIQVAIMCEADWLFLLTDVPCIYDKNPRVSTR